MQDWLTGLYQWVLVGTSDAKKWLKKAGLEALKDDIKDLKFHRKSEDRGLEKL